jgi:hypothetical protein
MGGATANEVLVRLAETFEVGDSPEFASFIESTLQELQNAGLVTAITCETT